VKIGIVVQRYGADINGGAELHARYIAEHLRKHVQVEVLTTCAADYITWRNTLPPGSEVIGGVTVRRFPVTRERDPEDFGRHSDRVFHSTHAFSDELAWLDAEGPTSSALVEYIRANADAFDYLLFFSFRYYHAYHGVRAVPEKALLIPTAERDGALGLSLFGPVFRGVRALMYNSFEERALIQTVSNNSHVPGVVVGIGSEIPPSSDAARFRQKFKLRDRFAIYIGRIDENKGCAELFEYFLRYTRLLAEGLHLVLIGTPVIPIPAHPKVHHLGYVDDRDKFDALAAAELLIMPSYFESLSMVALEAWALGKPVLANGRCDVLKGQCIRSNGGLYYDNFPEFLETLRAIDFTPSLAAALGRNGREYFNRHYAWDVIERKYLEMFERLKGESTRRALEPVPGWFARRRQTLPPANAVVEKLPKGAVLDAQVDAPRIEGQGFSPGHSTSHPVRATTRMEGQGFTPGHSQSASSERSRTSEAETKGRPSATAAPGAPSSTPRPPVRRDDRHRNQGHRSDRSRGPQRRPRPGGRPPRRSGNR
jgi:glycosyltransferase involved in cell wall biosynthesis